MGFNTTVIVMNDALGDIEADREFGKKLVAAIHGLSLREDRDKGINVSARNGNSISGNAATVVETHHADSTAIVAVGGNYAHVLGWAGNVPHHKDEGKLACLKALAEEMGFSLVKKAKK